MTWRRFICALWFCLYDTVTSLSSTAERLRNIDVGILVKDPFKFLEFPHLCGSITGNVAAGANFTVNCFYPAVGRFIKIQKTSMVDSNDLLTLCEVQVSGRSASHSEVTHKFVDDDVQRAVVENNAGLTNVDIGHVNAAFDFGFNEKWRSHGWFVKC